MNYIHSCASHNNNDIFKDLKNKILLNNKNSKNNKKKVNKLGVSFKDPSNIENIYVKSLIYGGNKWDWDAINDTNNINKELTYYFLKPNEIEDFPYNVLTWYQSEKNAYRTALLKWTDLIGIPQNQVKEVTLQNDANFIEILSDNFNTNSGTLGYHEGPDVNYSLGIYNRYNTNSWSNTLEPGGYGFLTLVHELGHGFGLSHPHDNGGNSSLFPGVSTSADLGDNNLNQNVYTVMTYNDIATEYNPNSPQKYGISVGPMAFDIAAMNFLYRLNPDYNNGDNIYVINDSNITNGIPNGYLCIYDTDGEDLIEYNGSNAINIDLRQATISNNIDGGGYVSKANNIYTGVTIANNTIIENLTSGSGNDNINQIDLVKNIIDGKNGFDKVIYNTSFNDFNIYKITDSHIKVSSLYNNLIITDELYNIESIEFNDITISKDEINDFDELNIYKSTLVLTDTWTTITHNKNFSEPVIIVSDDGINDASCIKIRNVYKNSFEACVIYPYYLKDSYDVIVETNVSCLIGENNRKYNLNGILIEFGKTNLNKLSGDDTSQPFKKVNLQNNYISKPLIFSQIQTSNEDLFIHDYLLTRVKDIKTDSFKITMQEAKTLNKYNNHIEETVGWMAITSTENYNIYNTYFDDINGRICALRLKDVSSTSTEFDINDESSINFSITKLGTYNDSSPSNLQSSVNTTGNKNKISIKVKSDLSESGFINHDKEDAFVLLLS